MPEVRAEAQLTEAGARWQYVSMETEAGLVTGRDMYAEAKIIGLKNVGSRSERDRYDGAKKPGWTDVEVGGGEEWVSGLSERTE